MLINCPECGHQISDTVKECPNCGYRRTSENLTKNRWINILGLCAIPFLLFFISQFDGREDGEYIYRFVALSICVVISTMYIFLKTNISLSKKYILFTCLVGICYIIIALTGFVFLSRYHDFHSYDIYCDSFESTTFEGVYISYPILLVIYVAWVYLTGASVPKRNKIYNGIIISGFIVLNVLTYHYLPNIVNNQMVSKLNYPLYGNANPVDEYISTIDQAFEQIEQFKNITDFQNPQSVISNDRAEELKYAYRDYVLSPSDKDKLIKSTTRTIIAMYEKYYKLSGKQIDASFIDSIVMTIKWKIESADKLSDISGIDNP